jgi:hypothetical protein
MAESMSSSAPGSSQTVVSELNIAYASVAIVEMIVRYLSGFDVMALWCTCSKAMQLRLARGAAREFVIPYTATRRWPANFFSVLRTLPMLHTVIIKQSSLTVWQKGPVLFEAFPATLRHVTFCLPMQLGVWLLLNTVPSTAQKPRFQARTMQNTKGPKNQTFRVDIPDFHMSERFPELESLNISGGSSYVASNSYHTIARAKEIFSQETTEKAKLAFARSLPATMKSLSLPELGDATWAMIKAMPESLNHIDIVCTTTKLPAFAFASFPHQLQSADLSLIDCEWEYGVHYLKDIPKSLQKLSVLVSNRSSADFLAGLSEHPMLHLSLSLLSLSHETSNALLELPKNLEYLELTFRQVILEKLLSYDIYPRALHTLIIHTLTFLPVDFRSWDPAVGFQALPKTLTKLEISSGVPMTDADIAFLPKSLTHLRLNIWRESFANWVAHKAPDTEFLCGLLTDACASFLPSELVYLKLDETYFGPEFLQNLPLNLKNFDFSAKRFGGPMPEGALDMLPQSLTSIALDVDLLSRSFGGLPSTVTRLTYRCGYGWHSKHFELLPKSLRYLEILRMQDIEDQYVAHLPRQLLELNLPDAVLRSTNALKDLPRSLQVLVLSKIIVPHPRPAKADILAQLPQHLQAYELPWEQKNGKKVDLSTLP